MTQLVQPVLGLRQDKAVAATLPVPATSADGVSVKTWRPGITLAGYTEAAIAIFADGAATVDNAALYAYGPYGIGGAESWMFVAYLNNLAQIVLTAALGFIQQIDLPTAFERLAVGGTVGGGANVGYTATPLAIKGS